MRDYGNVVVPWKKSHTGAILVLGGKQKAVFHTFLWESIWCSALHTRLKPGRLRGSYCWSDCNARLLISPNCYMFYLEQGTVVITFSVKLGLCDIIERNLFAPYQDNNVMVIINWCTLFSDREWFDSWQCQTLIYNSDLMILSQFLRPSF